MKKIISSLFLATTIASAHSISVHIRGIKSTKGHLYIGLYDEEKGFTGLTTTYANKILKANSKNMHVTFKNIPKGNYAISIFHDENDNGKFDKNFFGVPKEGYGISNNARHALRAPTFKEAMFTLNSYKKLTIKIGY